MPELPEVETIRRQLAPEVVGRRIEHAEVLDERWSRPEPPRAVSGPLAGATIEAVERRGKYLILRLDSDRALVMHLRMTGNLLLRPTGREAVADLMEAERLGGPRLYEGSPDTRYLRMRLVLDDGSEVLFTDPRRFGHGALMRAAELEAHLAARVGLEPLSEELTAEAIRELAAGRRAPLKSFLLGQAGVAGIGNIYADEALWRARLHPLSPAGSMTSEHCEALRRAIVEALEAGLANGGASIDDYRDLRGEQGSMQDEFLVHTREGQECTRCGAEIRRVAVGGRSTYFCPGCQKRLRRRRRESRRRSSSGRRTERGAGQKSRGAREALTRRVRER
jgi:formamidopyrimidine-DNA glycosylase